MAESADRVRLEGVGAVVVTGQRAVEVVGRGDRHEDGQDLLAVEGDLDPGALDVTHR